MEDGSPTLEVGFAIETGSSYDALIQLQQVMDSVEAKVVADAAAIERATGNMVDLSKARAGITAFGNAATKEARNAARELAQVERTGERLSRQLDRDASAFGKTRSEIRGMKVEAAALAAEQKGLTELAARLRDQESALYAQEFAAMRRARAEAEALAEDKQAAADQAAAAARREADAVREAAQAYRLFEAVAKQKSAAYRQREATAAAEAMRAEAAAAEKLAREHAELAAAVRGSHAAQEADAAAAERMRLSTDPLYAATKRLNEEIAESTRLYYAGATARAEYERQQEVLTGRLRAVESQQELVNRGMGNVVTSGRLAGHHMQNLAFQFQDLGVGMFAAAGSSAPLKMAFMTLIQQGAQIQGIMSQADIGIRGVAGAFGQMTKSVLLTVATNPVLLGLTATVGLFAGAVRLLQNAANDGADMKKYAEGLGLTAKEIRHLDNVTVTWGDTAKAVFQVAGREIWDQIGPAVTSVWGTMKDWTSWIFSGVGDATNFIIGGMVGAYNTITKTWDMLPGAIGDAFFTAVNAAVDAINALIRKTIDGLNWLGAQANRILPDAFKIPELSAPQISHATNQYAGALRKVGEVARKEMEAAMSTDYVGNIGRSVGGAIVDQAVKNAQERLRKQAEEKGYLDPDKAKTDKHAERLAREAAAIEAQIRNLYSLAEAYKVSGAAALIAEARVKAETDAIKKRGDIEAAVDRQIRLSIAQRLSDAAKITAGLRDQAEAQEAVNQLVAAGIIPAEAAADLVKDQIADLPLLAAAQAAQQRGLTDEAKLATAALEDQRKERLRLRDAEEAARFNSDMAAGANRLELLREELRLVEATADERERALAILKATQEAEKYSNPSNRDAYVAQQTDIETATRRLAAAQQDYNDALSFTAEKWDLIARNVQVAGQGMADAFGDAGRAIGDVASIYADYRAQEERAAVIHKANMAAASTDAARQREIAKHTLATSTMQVGLYGDLAAAAKGFFDEKSKGYKAVMAAEKVFRAFEFAMSVRAMVQDVAETVSSVANSAARATAAGTEGIAEQSKLPFPLNIAAMAATGAALIAAGIAVVGSLGGGGKNTLTPANNGTGTVLGDADAQSESIRRGIDALKEVDTVMLSYSREMAASLRSIESQIGGFASLLVRNADSINASGGITEGFKPNVIGSVLGSIPLVGGILKGLFGSKTTVIGSGLYGGAQSLGDILAGGFDASYYSDIKKKKKFFGLTTSTKYSTQYTGADAALENQFTLILREFNDAILAASGPLGAATTDIENRLKGFVVNIGKIDLQGLTGAEIEEKLQAVFGAAADNMAEAAFPGLQKFQKVGEGAFETLVRVASVVESVTASFDQLGIVTTGMSVDVKMAVADQFDSIGDLTGAVQSYFEAFYTPAEQAAAKAAQMGQVFDSLGLSMPATLDGFRALVEAQDLTTAAGRETWAALIQLAPAFADLKSAMEGAKSAADILAERQDLEQKLLEVQGKTAELRALELAKLDPSNRALQEQIWAIQDAQEAAKAADELRKAWESVGTSIMDEVKRIRGLSDAAGGTSYAALLGQFNAATSAAAGGDIDAAKSLPQLSQALLTAAANAATSRQELDRIRAQTAASLEAVYGLIGGFTDGASGTSDSALLDAAASGQGSSGAANDNGTQSLSAKLDALREELERLRADNNSGHAATAANTGAIKRTMDDITSENGGNAVSVAVA